MINIVYLVIIIIGGDGVTSQSIPQANMAQCQANSRMFNDGVKDKQIVANKYIGNVRAQKALCIVGVK